MTKHQISPKRTAKKPTPKALSPRVSLLIADDMREEQGGKLLAIGLYTDRILVAEPLPSGAKPTPESPGVLSSLAFVVTIAGVTGQLPIEISYSDPTLPKFGGKVEKIIESESPESAVNLIGKIAPFLFGGFGTKMVNVRVGDTTYPLEFRVLERGQAPPKVRFVEVKAIAAKGKAAKAPRKVEKRQAKAARPLSAGLAQVD